METCFLSYLFNLTHKAIAHSIQRISAEPNTKGRQQDLHMTRGCGNTGKTAKETCYGMNFGTEHVWEEERKQTGSKSTQKYPNVPFGSQRQRRSHGDRRAGVEIGDLLSHQKSHSSRVEVGSHLKLALHVLQELKSPSWARQSSKRRRVEKARRCQSIAETEANCSVLRRV